MFGEAIWPRLQIWVLFEEGSWGPRSSQEICRTWDRVYGRVTVGERPFFSDPCKLCRHEMCFHGIVLVSNSQGHVLVSPMERRKRFQCYINLVSLVAMRIPHAHLSLAEGFSRLNLKIYRQLACERSCRGCSNFAFQQVEIWAEPQAISVKRLTHSPW